MIVGRNGSAGQGPDDGERGELAKLRAEITALRTEVARLKAAAIVSGTYPEIEEPRRHERPKLRLIKGGGAMAGLVALWVWARQHKTVAIAVVSAPAAVVIGVIVIDAIRGADETPPPGAVEWAPPTTVYIPTPVPITVAPTPAPTPLPNPSPEPTPSPLSTVTPQSTPAATVSPPASITPRPTIAPSPTPAPSPIPTITPSPPPPPAPTPPPRTKKKPRRPPGLVKVCVRSPLPKGLADVCARAPRSMTPRSQPAVASPPHARRVAPARGTRRTGRARPR